MAKLSYLRGFGNEHSSEALPGALPEGRNSPQVCPYNLYAEQLSGSSFTMARGKNLRSWLYRIRPSVQHTPFERIVDGYGDLVSSFLSVQPDPNQMRWRPFPSAAERESSNFGAGGGGGGGGGGAMNLFESIFTMAGSGDASTKSGVGIHMYHCDASEMTRSRQSFVNSDGDMLVVPQHGPLEVQTEMGKLEVPPGHICVIPRGIRCSVDCVEQSRGYILEVYKGHFELPSLGPIGSNGWVLQPTS